MRVLVTYGSKRGGTRGIAEQLGCVLRERGLDVSVRPPEEVETAAGYDAFLVGGALYAGRWPHSVRRFVKRHASELSSRPVWLFSSGPLDDSASKRGIAPTASVTKLGAAIGARGHITFGGRLEPDAHGFIASKMARKRTGDWRNPDAIRGFASEVAAELAGQRGK
jgi:menaquinone-dependent protoporphyrinogen oxidase